MTVTITVKSGLGVSPMVTTETFDLGVSLYGNEHGTPRGVKLKHLRKKPLFLL